VARAVRTHCGRYFSERVLARPPLLHELGKIGVSTRAGAAIFAMERGLVGVAA